MARRASWVQAFSLRRNLADLFRPSPGRVRPLDGIRALSILWVVAFHTIELLLHLLPTEEYQCILDNPLLGWMVRGDLGVDLFFVLSGFLIGSMLIEEHGEYGRLRLGRFYARRAARLLPAYFIMLGVYRAFLGADCDSLWANLLYVNNYLPSARQCMSSAWSLAVEEQFYIVFPLLLPPLLVMRGGRLPLLFAVLLGATALRAAIVTAHGQGLPHPFYSADAGIRDAFVNTLYDGTHVRFGAILCGVIAADLRYHFDLGRWMVRRPGLTRFGLALALACLAVIGTAALGEVGRAPWPKAVNQAYLAVHRYAFAAAAAFILLASVTKTGPGGWIRRFLSARFWYPIAQLSYSTYLVHVLLILVVYVGVLRPRDLLATDPSTLLALFVMNMVICLLAALPLHLFVERPA